LVQFVGCGHALILMQQLYAELSRHVSFMQMCDRHIFHILPHFSHISAKCAYRIFFSALIGIFDGNFNIIRVSTTYFY